MALNPMAVWTNDSHANYSKYKLGPRANSCEAGHGSWYGRHACPGAARVCGVYGRAHGYGGRRRGECKFSHSLSLPIIVASEATVQIEQIFLSHTLSLFLSQTEREGGKER
jgi:hypothetical protein